MIIKLSDDFYLGRRLTFAKNEPKPEKKPRKRVTSTEYFKKQKLVSGWFRPLEGTR